MNFLLVLNGSHYARRTVPHPTESDSGIITATTVLVIKSTRYRDRYFFPSRAFSEKKKKNSTFASTVTFVATIHLPVKKFSIQLVERLLKIILFFECAFRYVAASVCTYID